MQRSGTEASRTQIHPSKPKREITVITNSQNTKRTYGQPSEQIFPKSWPLNNRNRTKNNTNTPKVKRLRNFDTKDSTETTCCVTDGDPWSAKQHHWKYEANEDHQLSPGGPSSRRKLRSQPTKMNSFRSQ